MTDGTGTTSYSYDSLHDLTSVTTGTSNTVGYTYDLAGNTTSITYPDSNMVTRTFDDDGRLHTVSDWNSHTTTYSYDADSNPTSEALPNGVTGTISYDNNNQPTAISYATASGTLAAFNYTRGDLGEITDTTTSGVVEPDHTYDYNSLHQLTGDTTMSGTASNSYSDGDNLTALNGTTLAYDNAGQLVSATPATGPTTTFAYNDRGDQTSVTTGTAITAMVYDAADNMTTYTPASGPATSYTYDGTGLRSTAATGSMTTTYTYDITAGISRLLTDGTTDYVYGLGGSPIEQVSSAGTQYLLQDQLGSTRVITDGSGTVTGTYSYDAWGNQTAHTGTASSDVRWAGALLDATGLYYLINRYYDPNTGNFTTVDPLVGATAQAYQYADGNPISETDASGLWPGFVDKAFHAVKSVGSDVVDAGESVVSHVADAAENIADDVVDGVKSVADSVACVASSAINFAENHPWAAAALAVGAVAAAAVAPELIPEEIEAEEAALADAGSGALRHYTTDAAAEAISKSGSLEPGATGETWLTPDQYSSGAEAQAKLALNKTPDGYYDIPACRVNCASGPSTVERAYGQPGGGTEYTTRSPISVRGLSFTRFE
jgi:RHS repeat-associated protein